MDENTNVDVFEETKENYPRSWVCRNTNEFVGWSIAIVLTSKESVVGLNKAHNWNMGSWIYGFGDDQITFKGLHSMKKKDM
jgi:hypothetical protein